MNAIDSVGFLGLTLLLSSFVLSQVKVMSNEALIYHIFNFAGGYILTYYAYVLGNTPFIILEFVWGSFSLYRIIAYLRSEKPTA